MNLSIIPMIYNSLKMNKYSIFGGCFFMSLIIFQSNCKSIDESPIDTNQKKVIHFEEQTVLKPPNFDTTLLKSNTQYNRDGKPIEETQYSKFDGSAIIHTKWTYDDHSNITSKITDNKEAGKVFQEKYTYEYDKKGRKVKMIEQGPNNPADLEHIFIYNNDESYTDTIKINGQILSILDYTKEDKIIRGKNLQQRSRIDNIIDEHGNYTERKSTFEDGPPNFSTYKNEYDEQGNLIRRILDHRSREYEYNENGDVIKEIRLNTGKPTLIILFKYEYFE